jgi:hypothetical protein
LLGAGENGQALCSPEIEVCKPNNYQNCIAVTSKQAFPPLFNTNKPIYLIVCTLYL